MGEQKSPNKIKQEYLDDYPGNTGKLAYHFFNEISFLHDKWNEYLFMYDVEQETIDILNSIAPYFFFLHQRMLKHDIIISISRLLDKAHTGRDKSQRNASFARIIEDLSPHVDNNIITEWKADLKRVNANSRNIKKMRDKFISHSDYDLHIDKESEKIPNISKEDIDQVLEQIRELANKIEFHFRGGSVYYQHIIGRMIGSEALMAFIKKYADDWSKL